VRAWWGLTLGSIVVSLLVVPVGLSVQFAVRGPPTGDGSVVVGTVALLPGFLLGATALWVAACE